MEQAFAVVRSRGPAWDDTKPLEGQKDWTAHAEFMDALFDRRFAVLVGPLEGTRDALLICAHPARLRLSSVWLPTRGPRMAF
jgi:hypothetical protein